jgi:hypothetical protein
MKANLLDVYEPVIAAELVAARTIPTAVGGAQTVDNSVTTGDISGVPFTNEETAGEVLRDSITSLRSGAGAS